VIISSLIVELPLGLHYWLPPCINYQRSEIMKKSQLGSSFPRQMRWLHPTICRSQDCH